MIRIGIAEDQALVRESLAIVLGLETDMEVCWKASTGSQAVDKARDEPVDFILMDLRLPELDGIAAMRRIKASDSRIQFVVLTTFHQDEWLLDALQAGAKACFLKEVPPKLLVSAIRNLQEGDWNPSAWSTEWRIYAPEIQFQARLGTSSQSAWNESLTGREIDLLRRIGSGLTNSEIASQMHLSEGTVKNYVSLLYAKLEVRDRSEAVKKARELGLS